MLDFYRKLDTMEQLGKDTVIPNSSYEAIYLSERGELFCYTGIHNTGRENAFLNSWPYYLVGKHTKDCKKHIDGFFRVKDGCVLLSKFIDQEFYCDKKYKSLKNYIIRFSVVNGCYFGIEERIERNNSWSFEEKEDLTRACFGLTYNELSSLTRFMLKN